MTHIPTPLGRRRIVLLGESAARGYFYDPTFSPAVVLQRLFRRLPTTQDVDVVDLARSNIDPAGIVGLARQSARLNPNLFIVFAGNNWSSSSFFDGVTRGELIEALARHGYRGYVDVIEKWRTLRTRTALNHLAGVADRADTPVIVVVPETNLLHWREDQALVVPVSGPLETRNGLAWRAVPGRPSMRAAIPKPPDWRPTSWQLTWEQVRSGPPSSDAVASLRATWSQHANGLRRRATCAVLCHSTTRLVARNRYRMACGAPANGMAFT